MLGLMGLSKKKLRACQHVYQTVANEKIYVLVEYTFRLQIGSSYVEEDVVFCKNISDIYLSRAGCRGLRLIHPDFPKQLHKNHILPKWVQSVTNSTVPSVNVDLPSKEHIEEVKQAIMSEFADVFSQGDDLKPMIGPPMQIHLKPDARPFALRTCRQIAFALRSAVKAEIDATLKKGIWEAVGDRPAEWCHPLVCVPKPNGKVRLCVDLTKLNSQVERVVYPSQSPRDVIQAIPRGSTIFSTFDAVQGYWQMNLAPESRTAPASSRHGAVLFIPEDQWDSSAPETTTIFALLEPLKDLKTQVQW